MSEPELMRVLVDSVADCPEGVRVFFRSRSGVALYTIVKESDDAQWVRRMGTLGEPFSIGMPPNTCVWRVSDENRKA